jgi:hypothetical protein
MEDTILSVLEGTLRAKGEDDKTIKLKNLRKMVFLSLQQEDEKAGKKQFKKAVQTLEKDGKLLLDSDGLISLPTKKKKKSEKRKRKDEDDDTPVKKHSGAS